MGDNARFVRHKGRLMWRDVYRMRQYSLMSKKTLVR